VSAQLCVAARHSQKRTVGSIRKAASRLTTLPDTPERTIDANHRMTRGESLQGVALSPQPQGCKRQPFKPSVSASQRLPAKRPNGPNATCCKLLKRTTQEGREQKQLPGLYVRLSRLPREITGRPGKAYFVPARVLRLQSDTTACFTISTASAHSVLAAVGSGASEMMRMIGSVLLART
jgi:hypothetical protein